MANMHLTEMRTRNLPGGKARPARKIDNVTALYQSIVQNSGIQLAVGVPLEVYYELCKINKYVYYYNLFNKVN
jgi:hypothetical protein